MAIASAVLWIGLAAPAAAMVTELAAVPGLDAAAREQLATAGITSPQQLLERSATHSERLDLAEATGLPPQRIFGWCQFVDLTRVAGVGVPEATLLDATGVNTAGELAKRRIHLLYPRLEQTNHAQGLLPHTPSRAQVQDWIRDARRLPRVLF